MNRKRPKLLWIAATILLAVLVFSAPGQAQKYGLEWDTDRPGLDYHSMDLPSPDPNLCLRECYYDPQCQAWTYVKPNTIQGPYPRCWLKYAVPPPQLNSCCVSGVK